MGDEIDLRLHALDHRLAFDPSTPIAPPRAALRFADLDTAGDILSGRASALGSICDGTLGMRGYIPMIDNVSRILDRVGHYLGEDNDHRSNLASRPPRPTPSPSPKRPSPAPPR